MRMIEQHELASISGGVTTVTIPRPKDDGSVTAKSGTIQIYSGTRNGSSGGGNAGGGGSATAATAPAKTQTTTTDTVQQVCVDPRTTEVSINFTGISMKMVGGCTSTRTFTTVRNSK
jgi:hypothetical protein